jgi:hypothetical protein
MSIEAMKLALEALEHEANKGNDNAYQCERDVLRAAIEQAEKTVECMCGVCKLGKREWVGLTDDEIYQIGLDTPIGATNFARAIEAKLKEKNA